MLRIDKEDKNLSNKYTDDLDFIIKDKLVINGNVNDYKSNDKVKELYLDTMDYKKYKDKSKKNRNDKSILKNLHFEIIKRYLFISKVIHNENKNTI